MLTLDAIVRRGARRNPDRVALIDGDVVWTWAAFDLEIDRTVGALRSLGIGPGRRVAAADYNSADYFSLYFAVARLGATLCPLNYLSAPAELAYVLADYEPDLVLAGPEFVDLVRSSLSTDSAASLVVFGDSSWRDRVARGGPTGDIDAVDPDSVHIVMYTSGTTGRPKGAAHTQAAHYLDGVVAALAFRLRDTDRYLVHAPSFHAACWDHAKLFWIADGSVVILPRFDPVDAMDAISRHGVTVLFGVPAVLRLLIDHPRWPSFDLSAIRLVYYGGALGSTAVLSEFSEALGKDVDYLHIYGLTEAGPFVSAMSPEGIFDKPGSIGRPIPGVEMEILDPVSGGEVPVGDVGEICVRAPTLMLGYWGKPDETSKALRNGWLHTGDLGTRDEDGDFYIVDRLKDMIRTGGENVYAREVEVVLLDHPQVAEAAVVGIPHEKWGEMVVAAVTPRTASSELTEDELAQWCSGYLARYKIPKHIHIVDALPKTGIGKIAKPALRADLIDRAR